MLTVGFDIYETSPGNLLIYAINHRRTGSTIERFHHTVGSGTLVYERSFDCNNDIVYTPNDVAIIGEDEFYVTNVYWHRYLLELIIGPYPCRGYYSRSGRLFTSAAVDGCFPPSHRGIPYRC